tara:strand:+ start:428 stop:898 length:471 start_codon:yes stop_codon:yes gene_type:complete
MNYSKYFSNILDNKLYILLILFTILVFTSISIYYYRKFVVDKINKKFVNNKEFLNKSDDNKKSEATFYFFYTTWCPHSKIAIGEIEKLKNATNSNVNGVNIIFRDIDSDQDNETTDKFEVKGYPTIKLIYDNKIYDYDAKPQLDTLLQFLNSVLTN